MRSQILAKNHYGNKKMTYNLIWNWIVRFQNLYIFILISFPKVKPFAGKSFAAKPLAATVYFLPIAALPLPAGHLQQNRTIPAKIGHLQENHLQRLFAATICSEFNIRYFHKSAISQPLNRKTNAKVWNYAYMNSKVWVKALFFLETNIYQKHHFDILTLLGLWLVHNIASSCTSKFDNNY